MFGRVRFVEVILGLGLAGYLAVGWTEGVQAHCDTLDGPVVTDARRALESGDVMPVLKWVRAGDEDQVRDAFRRTLTVRGLGPEVKELADTWFFETLVRLHRAGEGEPYTGLRPAGEIEPPVAAADEALANGDAGRLSRHLADVVQAGVQERFSAVREAVRHKNESVEAGRRYVEAYVTFVHFVEQMHALAAGGGSHH